MFPIPKYLNSWETWKWRKVLFMSRLFKSGLFSLSISRTDYLSNWSRVGVGAVMGLLPIRAFPPLIILRFNRIACCQAVCQPIEHFGFYNLD